MWECEKPGFLAQNPFLLGMQSWANHLSLRLSSPRESRMVRRPNKLIYVNVLWEPKGAVTEKIVAVEGCKAWPGHLGDSTEDTEGRACPPKGLRGCRVAFPLRKEAACNGVWCTISWVAHLPVRRAIVSLLLPQPCECENIPYYYGLISVDPLIIPAIHCGPTNSLGQKEIKGKMDQCFSKEKDGSSLWEDLSF